MFSLPWAGSIHSATVESTVIYTLNTNMVFSYIGVNDSLIQVYYFKLLKIMYLHDLSRVAIFVISMSYNFRP